MESSKPFWYKATRILLASLCLYQSSFCIDKYLDLPLSSEYNKVDAKDFPLPGFTVCPSTKTGYRKEYRYGLKDSDFRNLQSIWNHSSDEWWRATGEAVEWRTERLVRGATVWFKESVPSLPTCRREMLRVAGTWSVLNRWIDVIVIHMLGQYEVNA